jgi:hypothetical protein
MAAPAGETLTGCGVCRSTWPYRSTGSVSAVRHPSRSSSGARGHDEIGAAREPPKSDPAPGSAPQGESPVAAAPLALRPPFGLTQVCRFVVRQAIHVRPAARIELSRLERDPVVGLRLWMGHRVQDHADLRRPPTGGGGGAPVERAFSRSTDRDGVVSVEAVNAEQGDRT